MEPWKDFFVAVAGASAALTGLIFVGISINLEKILSFPSLPGRAALALGLLMTVLIVSLLCLVPNIPLAATGYIILGSGIATWIVATRVDLKILKGTKKTYKRVYLINLALTQLAILPYIFAGIFTVTTGEAGLYWLIPAFCFSLGKSVLDAWVLLIEIHR